jgi:hypothetical protein
MPRAPGEVAVVRTAYVTSVSVHSRRLELTRQGTGGVANYDLAQVRIAHLKRVAIVELREPRARSNRAS